MRVENLLFMRLTVAARGNAADIIFGYDALSDIATTVENVKIEMRRQSLTNFEASHAVAMAIEEWGICAEAKLRWEGRDDAAANAALCWYADPIDPFARIIIHPGTRHH